MQFFHNIMKGIELLVVGLLLVGTTGLNAAAEGGSPKDSAKWRLATLAAAREILDELDHPAPLSETDRVLLTERLNEVMRKDVAAHASRAGSQRLCTELATRFQREAMEKRFQAITTHAGEQSPLPVTWTDVSAHLGANWVAKLDTCLRTSAGAELAPLFKDARARAVGLLRQTIEQQIRYPTDAEADAMLADLSRNHPGTRRLAPEDDRTLQQKLLALLNPGDSPVFEELKTPLANQTHRIASELHRQYDRQLTLREEAARGIPGSQRRASVIAGTLGTLLESGISREQALPPAHDETGKPVPVYGLFSPVRDSLPGLASDMETSRFRAHLESAPALEINPAQLVSSMNADLEQHRNPDDSEALFMKTLPATLRGTVAAAYASEANPTGQSDYYLSMFTTNSGLAGTFLNRVGGELKKKLPVARKTISDGQFAKYFADLDEQGVLSPESLSHLQDSGGAAITNVTGALKLFGRSTRAEKILLQETVTRLLDLSNRKAREGYEVLTAQLALLRQLETERLEQLRTDVALHKPLREIRTEWESGLETRWKADSRSQSTPYKKLLEPALASLNKTVRQLYDTLQDNPQAILSASPAEAQAGAEPDKGKLKDARQEPARPEDQNMEPRKDEAKSKDAQPKENESSQKDDGTEATADMVLSRIREDRHNAPDGVLILTGVAGDNSIAKLITVSEDEPAAVSFNPATPQDAADTLFEALSPHMEILWKDTVSEWRKAHSGLGFLKRKTPPKVKLMVVIQSDAVRHRMSLLLRERFEQAFQEWQTTGGKGTPAVELDWKVGLTFTPQAGGT